MVEFRGGKSAPLFSLEPFMLGFRDADHGFNPHVLARRARWNAGRDRDRSADLMKPDFLSPSRLRVT
jgi:hypothetical protein